MKVLVIEDEELVRSLLRDLLEEFGCTVVEAEDGEMGTKALNAITPDLVITDILMPNKEGMQTISDIKARHPDMPVAAISGGGVTGNMTFLEHAKRLGADYVLRKPIDMAELEAIVDTLARSSKPQDVAS